MEAVEKIYTEEEVAKIVSSAYDSVALITELQSKETLTTEESTTLLNNQLHVRHMMGKVWFVAGLTDQQVTELQAI